MFRKKSSIWLAMLLGLISLGLACDSAQVDKANKLAKEATDIYNKTVDPSNKTVDSFNELMGDNLVKADDLEEYKTKNKAKFDELISQCDQLEKSRNEAAGKFEEASKIDVDAKFKEYCALKGQDYRKRAEADKARGAFIKTFLAEKDVAKINQQTADYNKKSGDMSKEAADISDKAEKVIKDNPSSFDSK